MTNTTKNQPETTAKSKSAFDEVRDEINNLSRLLLTVVVPIMLVTMALKVAMLTMMLMK